MSALHLFKGFGVELEYMLVHRTTLRAMPIADALLSEVASKGASDYANGHFGWSNELVNHVIEIKTNGPSPSLNGLAEGFHKEVQHVNSFLERHNAMLLPTAMHPFFDPVAETVLWPHESSEIYSLYNSIFDCRNHGWSNLQAIHLNLPFSGDAEFCRLHAAIRLVLPLLPALCASSPVCQGRLTGLLDTRLEYYRKNQEQIPVIGGHVIPERVFTKEEYHARIFRPINEALRPWDTVNILDHNFVNSRGAIARFDRNAIEIRLMDMQECPLADLQIISLVAEAIKALCEEKFSSLQVQQEQDEVFLKTILLDGIRNGSNASLPPAYREALALGPGIETAGEAWPALAEKVGMNAEDSIPLKHGNLSSRMLSFLGNSPSAEKIRELYLILAQCLHMNTPFLP